jgi:membrane fusion protein (multidrug efflux system)
MTASALLGACSEPVPPPRTVEVIVDGVVEEPYQPRTRYVGRLHARDDVTILARITGYLRSRDFRDGDLVAAGDVLYTIEQSEYEAALARARADLAAAMANQANAQRNYNRGLELLPRGAISQSEMDDLTAKKLDADARIESANAQIASAQVNLDYTTIRAPISGRIGRSQVSPGDLVGPNSGVLTTLVSVDPIQALFQITEATYVGSVTRRMSENRDIDEVRNIEVTLELTTGLIYPEVGRLDYLANRVDETTGTLEARALIPNPHSLLVPGQYVQVILQDTNLLRALFLPQAAVQADQQGSFVLVVNSGSVVERRNVELGDRFDDLVMVYKGVDEGDRVIVRGLQQVRPGMPVEYRQINELQE